MSSPRAERCGGHSRCIVFFLDWLYYENKLVLSSFFLSTRAYSISPDHISRSQCDGLCRVTLSHTYTHRGGPTLNSKKFANKELRAHNKDSECNTETRTRLPVWVCH
jgi:hypothetical protein